MRKQYTNGEELANTLSHGTGILLGVITSHFLLTKVSHNIEPQWAVTSVCVYLFG